MVHVLAGRGQLPYDLCHNLKSFPANCKITVTGSNQFKSAYKSRSDFFQIAKGPTF